MTFFSSRTGQRAFLASSLAIAIAATSTASHAGEPKADAEQAFREGRTLLAAGELERACAKFAESQKLDPAAGTLLNLGECLDKRGMAASARTAYLDAAKAAQLRGRADWERFANARAAALDKEVSTITLVVNPEASRVKGLEVTRDGEKDEWNNPVPVDAGTHIIEAKAAGHRSWSTKLTVGRASALRVEIPKLDDLEQASATTPPAGTPAQGTDDRDGSGQRTVGIIVGGVGAAGLIFGGVTGLLAKSKHDDAISLCPSYPDHCPADGSGTRANDSAKSFATMSTIGFVAGGALLVGGAVLFFTAPSSSAHRGGASLRVAPVVAKDTVSLDLTGRF